MYNANILKDIGKMDKFYGKHKLRKPTEEGIVNLNSTLFKELIL